MNRNLDVLMQCVPMSYSVAVRTQEEGYSLVLNRGQAWLFVPEAEYEETRRYYAATGTLASMDSDARSAQVA